MNENKLKKIILEEISNFDFLSQKNIKEDTAVYNILNNANFQKSFVKDVIDNPSLIKVNDFEIQQDNREEIDPDWDTDISIDYSIEIEYEFMGKNIPMNIYIEGEIQFDMGGYDIPATRMQPPEHRYIDKVYYEDSDLKITTNDGEEVKSFKWLDNNKQLKARFLNSIINNFSSK